MSETRSKRHPELVRDEATSKRLGRVRQRDTGPELIVRRMLHGLGGRYRRSSKKLPGSPDIVNWSRRWAVFVHGCFWHWHNDCGRASVPKRNRAFWLAKLNANRRRDCRVIADLEALGFRTMVLWECEIEERPLDVERKLSRFLARVAR
ncbi:very short patch repair endonuclease [Anaeromyxobacter dehalogenans]|uniref:Very short patch repair endonuclease n=1 Tax=Anaeromyxobacter dehalogenans (strain 2CP-C) TaxID=290397 RepID=Q2IF54_ANADE|nr:very short patch repair endonuclease [Anaeromyxobacter dehalogenans]ABC83210.1 T/G mismatch-specific endonuclease [Anaeromyxobacter dehalogenans 2CP-C]